MWFQQQEHLLTSQSWLRWLSVSGARRHLRNMGFHDYRVSGAQKNSTVAGVKLFSAVVFGPGPGADVRFSRYTFLHEGGEVGDTKEGKWAKQESRKREREQAQAAEAGREKAARVSQEVAELRAAMSRAGRLAVRE